VRIWYLLQPPYDGTLARYYKLRADLAYPLAENMSFEDGAMVSRSPLNIFSYPKKLQIEPLAVGVHAVYNIGRIRANQNVAVFGAGPVGLLCMAVAKACGANRVIGIDILQSRLDFARKYAATDVFLSPKQNEGESKMDFSKRVAADISKKLNIPDRGENSLDLIIDASGAEVCIQMALFLAKQGGESVFWVLCRI
jgi:D-xylulose reductase